MFPSWPVPVPSGRPVAAPADPPPNTRPGKDRAVVIGGGDRVGGATVVPYDPADLGRSADPSRVVGGLHRAGAAPYDSADHGRSTRSADASRVVGGFHRAVVDPHDPPDSGRTSSVDRACHPQVLDCASCAQIPDEARSVDVFRRDRVPRDRMPLPVEDAGKIVAGGVGSKGGPGVSELLSNLVFEDIRQRPALSYPPEPRL